MKISSIGYRTLILDLQKDKAGTIILKEESTMLKGIVVNGERPLVKAEKGALTYDVEAMAEKAPLAMRMNPSHACPVWWSKTRN